MSFLYTDAYVEHIAKVCHEANRAYCEILGDTSQPAWADAPEWQIASAMNGVRFHIDNPNAGPSASHDNWLAEKLANGWRWGPEKDPNEKTHPCILPYNRLPAAQQIKDAIFIGIVHGMTPRD